MALAPNWEPSKVTATDRVMLFDVNEERAAMIAATLNNIGLKCDRCHWPSEARSALANGHPGLVIVVGADKVFAGLGKAAGDLGVPALAVIDLGDDPRIVLDQVRNYQGWTSITGLASELPIRVMETLERYRARTVENSDVKPPSLDARFLALVIHDLRTPLNVIGLTIRAISQCAPPGSTELDEDLTFLTENARQMEKMLTQLADYCRLIEVESPITGTEFDPRRFLSDFLEDRPTRPGSETPPVHLEVAESCPIEVSLDPSRARLALQHALANVVSAAMDTPIRLRASGRPGKLVIEIAIEKPPPATVSSIPLRSDRFERLTGVAAERRGLDLAIASRVTELFHGQARLEIEPGRRSVVVLEWPERLDSV